MFMRKKKNKDEFVETPEGEVTHFVRMSKAHNTQNV
jgi:hypothetical protein